MVVELVAGVDLLLEMCCRGQSKFTKLRPIEDETFEIRRMLSFDRDCCIWYNQLEMLVHFYEAAPTFPTPRVNVDRNVEDRVFLHFDVATMWSRSIFRTCRKGCIESYHANFTMRSIRIPRDYDEFVRSSCHFKVLLCVSRSRPPSSNRNHV